MMVIRVLEQCVCVRVCVVDVDIDRYVVWRGVVQHEWCVVWRLWCGLNKINKAASVARGPATEV